MHEKCYQGYRGRCTAESLPACELGKRMTICPLRKVREGTATKRNKIHKDPMGIMYLVNKHSSVLLEHDLIKVRLQGAAYTPN